MSDIAPVIEKITGDKSWQDSLTDEERKTLLEWASVRFESALSAERTVVMRTLRMCNYMMQGKEGSARLAFLKMVMGVKEDGNSVQV